jgi:SNF2 family DNA or RNA helicase
LRLALRHAALRNETARAQPATLEHLARSSSHLRPATPGRLSRASIGPSSARRSTDIKSTASATARTARDLKASHRFSATGHTRRESAGRALVDPSDTNPGILGPLETFRREYALPIERYGNDDVASRLRRIVGPFILRRLKSDPSIVRDLPPKNEMKVICTLTREQATLYKAVVDEEMRRIAEAEGMERRGRVLALLTFTKQICNHPAQYLSDGGPLAKRSGKLMRVTEMLEEAVSAGDKALLFTQFREMGDRLTAHLAESLGCEVAYLHGGTPKKARDEMVRRFQDEPHGPRIFVLSLKAGGTFWADRRSRVRPDRW